MKALRFIATFSFLLIFSPVIFSQTDKDTKPVENKDAKTVETPANKETIKPAERFEPIPIKVQQERYRIGMHDVIEVTVAKHPELSLGSVRMDEYGRIRLPRIEKSILAICKTENELANEIRKIYADTYLRDPFVSVVVREQNSQPFSVIGAVKNPGRFYTTRRLTLLDVLSWAGGPDVEFAGNTVQVARIGGISGCVDKEAAKTEDETIVFFSYKLPEILKGKTNPVLSPGDIVSVLDADTVFVYGNVNKEGQVKMREPITLLQAIVSAEGLKPASKSKIRVLRQKEGSSDREELVFDLDDIKKRKIQDPFLQPNDIIAVSEDPIKSIVRNITKTIRDGVPSILYRVP
jgi:polysaccharide export outer membrane protein